MNARARPAACMLAEGDQAMDNSDQARQFSTGACFGTTRLRLTLPIFRTMRVKQIPRFSDSLTVLGSSDEDARNEHECSSKSHLRSCGEDWRVHEPVSHPSDDPKFD